MEAAPPYMAAAQPYTEALTCMTVGEQMLQTLADGVNARRAKKPPRRARARALLRLLARTARGILERRARANSFLCRLQIKTILGLAVSWRCAWSSGDSGSGFTVPGR
eukprot:2377424-Rhodomonas_salina.2